MSLQQAADYMGVKERHIYYLVDMGSLEAWKVGKLWRFEREAVDRYVRGKYVRRTYKKSSRYFNNGGNGFLFELLDRNGSPTHKEREDQRIPHQRRLQPLEHKQVGPHKLPVKPLKPVEKSGSKARYKRPVQEEFDFGIAV
jgi:excisionase family DNA binding protein